MKLYIRFLRLIALGSLSMLLSACYGVYLDLNKLFTAHVNIKDSNNDPIPGIQVTYRDVSLGETSTISNETGTATLDIYNVQDSADRVSEDSYFQIQDIDGEENGSFQDKNIPFDYDAQRESYIIDVVLEESDL